MGLSTIKLKRKKEHLTDEDEMIILALWFLNREYKHFVVECGDFDEVFQAIATGILIALRKAGHETVGDARKAEPKKFKFTNFARFYVHHEVMEMMHLHKWWPISIPRKVASSYGAIGASKKERRLAIFTELAKVGGFTSHIEGPFAATLRKERRREMFRWVNKQREPNRSLILLRLAGKEFNEIDRILGISSTSGRFSRIIMDLNPALKRGGMVTINCIECGKPRTLSSANARKAKFCSIPCAAKYKTGKIRGDEVLWDDGE